MKVIDLIVDVTQEDIDHGKRGACDNCPTALALQHSAGDSEAMVIDEYNILLAKVWGRYYILPRHVQDLIEDYDGEGPMKPFHFTLEILKEED